MIGNPTFGALKGMFNRKFGSTRAIIGRILAILESNRIMKSNLLKSKPMLRTGRAVSQLEAPSQ